MLEPSTSGDADKKEMDWMYGGTKSIVDREKYLLGAKIDKNFELYGTDGSKQTIGGVEALLERAAEKSTKQTVGSSALDLETVKKEDPLVAIRVREEKARQEILKNPVKMKRLHNLLESAMKDKMMKMQKELCKAEYKAWKKAQKKELRKKKKRKKEKHDNESTDEETQRDCQTRSSRDHLHSGASSRVKRNRDGRRPRQSPSPDRRSDPNGEESSRKTRKRTVEKRAGSRDRRVRGSRSPDRRRRRDGDSSSRPHRPSASRSPRAHEQSTQRSDRGSTSIDRRKSHDNKSGERSAARSNETSTVGDSKRNRRASSSESARRHSPVKTDDRKLPPRHRHDSRSSSSSASPVASNRIPRGPAAPPPGLVPPRSSPSHSDKSSSSSNSRSPSPNCSDSDEDRKRKSLAGFGLVHVKKRLSGNETKSKSTLQQKTATKEGELSKQTERRKPLSEEEKAARLQEMQANADWRERQRGRNLQMYAAIEQQERERNETGRKREGADFVRPMLADAAESSSLAERINRKRHNVQRSHGNMERSFTKK